MTESTLSKKRNRSRNLVKCKNVMEVSAAFKLATQWNLASIIATSTAAVPYQVNISLVLGIILL